MLANQRATDIVARNGGEEFVVLLLDTGAEGALEAAEKLRDAIATIKLPRVERAITASFGVAIHTNAAGDAETLLRLADRALYAAKNAGRNRVKLAGSEQPAPLTTHSPQHLPSNVVRVTASGTRAKTTGQHAP